MPCSSNVLLTLQTEFLSTKISGSLRQIIFLESFYSLLKVYPFTIKMFITDPAGCGVPVVWLGDSIR